MTFTSYSRSPIKTTSKGCKLSVYESKFPYGEVDFNVSSFSFMGCRLRHCKGLIYLVVPQHGTIHVANVEYRQLVAGFPSGYTWKDLTILLSSINHSDNEDVHRLKEGLQKAVNSFIEEIPYEKSVTHYTDFEARRNQKQSKRASDWRSGKQPLSKLTKGVRFR